RSQDNGQTWAEITLATIAGDINATGGVRSLRVLAGNNKFYFVKETFNHSTSESTVNVSTTTDLESYTDAGSSPSAEIQNVVLSGTDILFIDGDQLRRWSDGSFSDHGQVPFGQHWSTAMAASGGEAYFYFADSGVLKKVA